MVKTPAVEPYRDYTDAEQARQISEFGLQLGPIAHQAHLDLTLFALHRRLHPQGLTIHYFEGLTIGSSLFQRHELELKEGIQHLVLTSIRAYGHSQIRMTAFQAEVNRYSPLHCRRWSGHSWQPAHAGDEYPPETLPARGHLNGLNRAFMQPSPDSRRIVLITGPFQQWDMVLRST